MDGFAIVFAEREAHAVETQRYGRADDLRVAAARVLMQSPDVILADEPTASLDPELAETMTSLLAGLARDGQKTLIMAVHRVDLALRHFPRVIGLRDGGLSFDVPPSEVHGDLLGHLYTRDGKSTGERDGDHLQYKLGCTR